MWRRSAQRLALWLGTRCFSKWRELLMLEKEMEDLIAKYPTEFFSRRQIRLCGRQQPFDGVGKFDLLFRDKYSTILMELKVVTLKCDHAPQIIRYYNELKRKGVKSIEMWLVAPKVPPPVKTFLEDQGIHSEEIQFDEFRRIAERHGHVIKSEQKESPPSVLSRRADFVEIGETLLKDKGEWKHVDAGKNFCKYIESFGIKKSIGYEDMKIVRELLNTPVSRDDLKQMARQNALQLIEFRDMGGKITARIIDLAKRLSEKQFKEKIGVVATKKAGKSNCA
jgi:hypothetical protein